MAARQCAAAVICALLTMVGSNAASPDTSGAASIAAKRHAILDYVRWLRKNHKSLVGVQVNEYEVYIDCTSSDRVFALTGARPAIMGLELMSAIAYPPYASYLTDRAATQEASGGLVTMSWHERNPVEVCPRGEYYDCTKKPMTTETLRAVLTDGTPEHRLWLADVDAVAKVLSDWRDRGIVVLFRPYHEMNGDWFWWGQKDAYPQLWNALYEELAVKHKLDNLIWVWSGDRATPDAKRYFPSKHRPDVVGIDVYENDPDSPKYAQGYKSVTAVAGKTPFALTEVGMIPSAAVLDALNPAWVLLWGGEYLNGDWAWNAPCPGCNTPERVKAFFDLPRTLTLDEMPDALRATLSSGVAIGPPLHPPNPVCPAKLH